jgi:uncharacterized protein
MQPLLNIFWNAAEHRLRAFWRMMLQLLAMFAFSGLVAIPIIIFQFLDRDFVNTLASNPFLSTSLSILSGAIIFLSVWVCARWVDHRSFKSLGFHFSNQWGKDFMFGLVLGAVLMVFIFATEYGLGWVSITAWMQSTDLQTPFLTGLLETIALFICVGIYEETFSRGYQLHNLAEGLNFKRLSPRGAVVFAWILSSSFFGLMHAANPNASLISTVNLVGAGLFLGLAYVLTGDLAISIGLHITWNFFQGNVFGFPVSGSTPIASFILIQQKGDPLYTGGLFGPEAGLIGLLAMLLGCVLILTWVYRTRQQIKIQDHLAIYLPGDPQREVASADVCTD